MLNSSHLAIDVGNTRTKVLFQNSLEEFTQVVSDFSELKELIIRCKPTCIVVSDVRGDDVLKAFLEQEFPETLYVNSSLKYPFKILYDTPKTLGSDRLANISGVHEAYSNDFKHIMVVDGGTCIKYDYLIDNSYLGGNISPGILMRAKAMNEFTGKLPLVDIRQKTENTIGKNTAEALINGVLLGVKAELTWYINNFLGQYPAGKIVITGGNFDVFELESKNVIFADPEITLRGLHYILQANLL